MVKKIKINFGIIYNRIQTKSIKPDKKRNTRKFLTHKIYITDKPDGRKSNGLENDH